MPLNPSLLALLMGRSIVDRVSERYGLAGYDLRTLGAVHCLLVIGRVPTVRAVAELQGMTTTVHPRKSIAALRVSGLLDVAKGANKRLLLALSATGLRLVGLLEREERDARRRVQSIALPRRKRAYVKSGKFIGKAARQAERAKRRGDNNAG